MLTKLRIEQFVIIDTLDVDFKPGLTVITGETGAGKSIILGAMGLILGEESNPKSIRQGAEQSTIDANFKAKEGHAVVQLLRDNSFLNEGETEFSVHRTLKTDGSETISLNGKPIDVKTLKRVGEELTEIHGQSANHTLLGPANQLSLLDLCGNFGQEYFDNVSNALDDVKRYTNELKEEKNFLMKYKGLKLKQLEDVNKKFESVEMKEGFFVQAKAEYAKLRTAKETMEAFQSIQGRLIAGNGVVVSLSAANNTLSEQKNVEAKKIKKLSEYLDQALSNARNAVEEMNLVSPQYEIDLGPLEKYKSILTTLKEISQQAKIPFEDVEKYWVEQSTKLKRVQNGRDRMAELKDLLIDAKNRYREHASILTEKRTAAGKTLSTNITQEFQPLKLNKAEFEVLVEEKPENPWTAKGFNEITFKARMNPGMPFSPISDTASGGEMARMILALKVILQQVQKTPTLVFDEIDIGIGGAAAAAVGDRISFLTNSAQVLVITHSPQVAARGDQHLFISKKTDGVTTVSSVRPLSIEERTDEISRMLAGGELTDASRAAATSLIQEAQQIKGERNEN